MDKRVACPTETPRLHLMQVGEGDRGAISLPQETQGTWSAYSRSERRDCASPVRFLRRARSARPAAAFADRHSAHLQPFRYPRLTDPWTISPRQQSRHLDCPSGLELGPIWIVLAHPAQGP